MAINNSAQDIVVVMVPLPAQGHLNQLLHLSRLISAYDIPVQYIGTTTHNRQAKTRVHGWNPLVNSNILFHEFPIPSFHTPPPNPNAPTKFPSQLIPSFHASLQLREHISKLVFNLSTSSKRVIVIHDHLMTYHVQDIIDIPNAESYCFYSCSVFTLYTFIWETAGKPNIPESNLFENLPSIESCFNPEVFEFTKLNQECKKSYSGYLYNTCRALEGRFFDLVARSIAPAETDKNWAIGPFNPITTISNEKRCGGDGSDKYIEWLDKQEMKSVIFVSFGTTTSFSDEELNEIAVGLEKSGQKFIWVVREADKGDVFITNEEEKRKLKLPKGYEERNKEKGIIIREWAPQLEILGHKSTGGFMSHCGWNSCIESISFGVPIAAWPMHSDQPRNAILITKLLKIGITVKDWDQTQRDGIVKAEIIENAVRKLMDSSEGDEMRKRAVQLSEDVKKSVREGGQSHLEMESFIAHISR